MSNRRMQPKDGEWGNAVQKKGRKKEALILGLLSGGIILIESNSMKNISIKMASE